MTAWRQDERERWACRIEYLRENYPVLIPVRVVRQRIAGGHAGDTTKTEKGFRVRVHSDLAFSLAVDTLVHEWAHCLAWDLPGPAHSAAWGVLYADLYRELIDQW